MNSQDPIAESRHQARAYQARQKELRNRAKMGLVENIKDEPLVQRGGFRPFLEF